MLTIGIVFCCLFMAYTIARFVVLYVRHERLNRVAEGQAEEREDRS